MDKEIKRSAPVALETKQVNATDRVIGKINADWGISKLAIFLFRKQSICCN
jgi:hypothetical protein